MKIINYKLEFSMLCVCVFNFRVKREEIRNFGEKEKKVGIKKKKKEI